MPGELKKPEESLLLRVEFGRRETVLMHPNSRPTVQANHRDICDALLAGGDVSAGRALHFLAIFGR